MFNITKEGFQLISEVLQASYTPSHEHFHFRQLLTTF